MNDLRFLSESSGSFVTVFIGWQRESNGWIRLCGVIRFDVWNTMQLPLQQVWIKKSPGESTPGLFKGIRCDLYYSCQSSDHDGNDQIKVASIRSDRGCDNECNDRNKLDKNVQ